MSMPEPRYEIDYFQKYRRQGKIVRSIHGARGYLYRYWLSFFRRNMSPTSVIVEIGCGLGFFGRYLQKRFIYIGFDISLDALQSAQKEMQIANAVQGRAQQLPFRDQGCQALIAFDVVEHLPEPLPFFAEAMRVLCPGGIMVISTPNTRSLGVRVKSKTKDLTPSMHTDPTHVSLLPPETWLAMVEQAGFTVVRHGTDTLWDMPYSTAVPLWVQKMALIPLNILATRLYGFFRWRHGENLILIARK